MYYGWRMEMEEEKLECSTLLENGDVYIGRET